MAVPATTLVLRSDVNKGLTAPSTTLRLRTQDQKEKEQTPVAIGST